MINKENICSIKLANIDRLNAFEMWIYMEKNGEGELG